MNKTDSTHIAFVPKGDSMWPFLKNKKQTVIIDKEKTDIKEYDVILYTRANGGNILHRVIKIADDIITCCGDSQFVTEQVQKTQIVGVMIGYYKKEKYLEVDQKYREKAKKYYKKNKRRKLKVRIHFIFKKFFKGK